jgi:hypothetical protein
MLGVHDCTQLEPDFANDAQSGTARGIEGEPMSISPALTSCHISFEPATKTRPRPKIGESITRAKSPSSLPASPTAERSIFFHILLPLLKPDLYLSMALSSLLVTCQLQCFSPLENSSLCRLRYSRPCSRFRSSGTRLGDNRGNFLRYHHRRYPAHRRIQLSFAYSKALDLTIHTFFLTRICKLACAAALTSTIGYMSPCSLNLNRVPLFR